MRVPPDHLMLEAGIRSKAQLVRLRMTSTVHAPDARAELEQKMEFLDERSRGP
jgi:hypothetical protein